MPVDAQQPIRNTALGPVEFAFLRQQPANLVTYMDGKTGVEELIARAIRDDALLKSLATTQSPYLFACYCQVDGRAV